MLKIIAILIVLGLLGCLLGWIKDHAKVIIGLIAIAVMIPIGRAFLPGMLKTALAVLPKVLLILLVLLVIGAVYFCVMKSRSRTYLAWLKDVGIGPQSAAPGDERVWEWAQKHDYAKALEHGLVLSCEFCDLVKKSVDQGKIIAREQLQSYCLRWAPSFQVNHTALFLDHLKKSGLLLPICEGGKEAVYLAPALKNDCKRRLELEGAATADEFAVICKSAASDAAAQAAPRAIAETLLSRMVKEGAARKVKLSDLGETLYVANRAVPNSKLVRREVSLD